MNCFREEQSQHKCRILKAWYVFIRYLSKKKNQKTENKKKVKEVNYYVVEKPPTQNVLSISLTTNSPPEAKAFIGSKL